MHFFHIFFEHGYLILPSSIQIDTIDLYRLGRLWLWYKSAEFRTSEIEPPRPLPSIGLSHLPVRNKNDQGFRFSIDLYGNCRTKPREASEIRRVTDAWNTPARLVSFPTVRYVYEASGYSKRFETNSRYTDDERPATSGFRFNLELYGGFGPRMR